MRAPRISASRWSSWCGPVTEGIFGGLTLLVGAATVLALGFGPWTCAQSGTPCYGLLGPSISRWADAPAVLAVWLPLLNTASLGTGAVQNACGQRSHYSPWRWAAALVLCLSTLTLLVTAPLGVFMIPVALIAYATAGIGQVRAQRGEAPDSIAGPIFGALATVAAVAITFLAVQWALLLVRQ